MRISGFTSVRPDMPHTRTFEDFNKWLGSNPTRLGIVSSLYDQYTASYLTEAIGNLYTLDRGKQNEFQKADSFVVEWDLRINNIKRVYFTSVPVGDGSNGSEIQFRFGENYYQKYDTFIIENTRQQIIVLYTPQRISDNEWLVVGKIQDSDYASMLDTSGTQIGMATRFLTNFVPELHEIGYSKYQSNLEKHRTFIGTHRADGDMSAQYAVMEKKFIQIGRGEKDDPWYEMNSLDKDVLDTFMLARNNALVWSKTNMNVDAKPKIYEPGTNRPIISGDGLIPQIERFASKFVFVNITAKLFNNAMAQMVAKSEKATGNTFAFIVNTMMWNDFQNSMQAWIRDFRSDATFIYSKAANGYVDLGATYQSYEFGGNSVVIKIDRAFDIEFPTRKFGIFVDLTADSVSGKPAIAAFTIKEGGKSGQLIRNTITGVGGLSGLDGGEVASPVAGTKIVIWGYSGIAVFNPYRSVILMSNPIVRGF